MWSNQYWAKTYWAGNYWTPAITSPSVPSIGGGTLEIRRKRRWEKEKEVLKFSLRKIEDQELQSIGQKIIAFEQPKVKRVVRKLIDYSQNIEKFKVLDLEIKRLEKALKTQQILEAKERQKQKELQDALMALKALLKEDMEIIDIYLEIEQKETMALLSAMRVIL
jgi:hypothetical protein